MFAFGFSYTGVVYLLMLYIPNIIWAKHQPQGYSAKGENNILKIFERIGEILCTCCVLIFSDFNIRFTEWIVWLILSFLMMIFYELYWIRYFKSEKTLNDFYKPFLKVVVPGATFPVIAFLLLGIYGTNIFMIISGVILSIGHIGIHLQHYKELDPEKSKLGVRIIKGVICTVLCLILAVLSFFIGIRNYNYIKHYQITDQGIDEGLYVELGNQKQYVLIRGANVKNPVIIYLHGGPSSPESYINYSWVDDLVDDYTIVDWDQRGCGRTYEYNCDTDPNNETATFDQALTDLDDLVQYVNTRFEKQKVILIGHSYGTVLATKYMEQHPDKVSSYIGIAQVISMDIDNHALADEASVNAKDASSISKALQDYDENPSVSTTMALREIACSYLEEPLQDESSWMALTSPYMGIEDFKWFLIQLKPMDEYIELNKQLYDSLLEFNLYDVHIPQSVSVTFISGSLDTSCPISTIEDYINQSEGKKALYTVDKCGHNVQYTKPHEVSQIILNVLNNE